jgi:predicted metal-binding membrane protein
MTAEISTPAKRRWSMALRSSWRRPTVGVEIAVAVAWITLVVLTFAFHRTSPNSATITPSKASSVGLSHWALICVVSAIHHYGGGMSAMLGMPSPTGAATFAASVRAGVAGLLMWTVMCVAMMLPAMIPAVRYVAVNSLRWRRRRAILEFVGLYLGIWIAFGAIALTAYAWWAPAQPDIALSVVLAVAAVWQLTKTKRRALLRCHQTSPLPPRGWKAEAGVARFALRNGGACLVSCWALMLIMVAATSGGLVWMMVLAGIVSAERLTRKPRRPTRYAAALLGAAAVGAAVVAIA